MPEMTSFELINQLAKKNHAQTYLEIGVHKGSTFLNVTIPHKVAVDPRFLFDPKAHANADTLFYSLTSDEFFERFKEDQKTLSFASPSHTVTFDIIFIDGYHSYEQSYTDFLNSLELAHESTIWVLDDTLPWDPFSAYPNQAISLKYRALYGFTNKPWHGDVFKTVFAIHDEHPEFSYATHYDRANGQTILWKTKTPAQRIPYVPKEADPRSTLAHLSFYAFFESVRLANPHPLNAILPMIGSPIDDADFANPPLEQLIHPLPKQPDTALQGLKATILEELAASRQEIRNLSAQLAEAKACEVQSKDKLQTLFEDRDAYIVRVLRRHIKRSRNTLLIALAASAILLLLLLELL